MDVLGAALTLLPGGYSGETFLAEVAGDRAVVRVYAASGERRGPHAAEIDAAVLRLVRGLVPVPDVLEVRRPDASAGTPGLLVTSFVAGERLDVVLDELSSRDLAAVGTKLGALLARLSQMPMLRAGTFLDGSLTLGDLPATDLSGWGRAHGFELGPVAEEAQDRLDEVGRHSLVHGDLNPKNVLVDPTTLEVSAVVDWEFAHAGSPYADLGNLLRFEREPAFHDAVLSTFVEGVPGSLNALDRARSADLWSVVELAARQSEVPPVARARDLLEAITSSGNLHAV